jgi:F-type H+-transporting ATPase subunit epsilon
MESTIFIKILSPFQTELEEQVSYIEVHTATGQIGIYPNHIPLITNIEKCKLKIKLQDGTLKEFTISEGFLRLINNECNIITKNLIPC